MTQGIKDDHALRGPAGNGYMGHVLEVDLTEETICTRPLDAEIQELFLGGRAMAVALLFQRLARKRHRGRDPIADIDPLSGDNPLVFCTSPLTGTSVPTSSRYHVAFKSPLTSGIGSSNSGGKWGVELKRAGFDALVVEGRATRQVTLIITEDGARFETFDGVDSNDVEAVTDAIQDRLGRPYKVMTVGAAGRSLSPIACIINDRGRALGRGGAGAVFGSKNLMAIAVRGNMKVPVHSADGLAPASISGSVFKAKAKLRMGKMTKSANQYGILSSMGTNGLMGMLAQYDELVHRNFSDNEHLKDDLAKIQGEAFLNHPDVKVRRGACRGCPIGCTRVTEVLNEAGQVVSGGEGPEFETVAMLGANLHIYNLKVITEANYLCNRYGFDTISMGGAIAALMEIYSGVEETPPSDRTSEEEALFEEAAPFVARHGPPLFGNHACLVPLVESAAKGEGIGRMVALGARRLAEQCGHPEAAMTVKGLELPAYDPRATWTQALSYMISPRGGCHLQGGYSAPLAFCAGYGEFPGDRTEGAALVVRNICYQNYIYDMLGVCAFIGFSVTLDELASMLGDVVGKVYKGSDLEHVARRALTLEKLFNHRAGLRRSDDWLPERFFDATITVDGRETRCHRRGFSTMRREFYESMGWDETGHPPADTLEETDLQGFLHRVDGESTPGDAGRNRRRTP